MEGCIRSSRKYTIEAMANNFASGTIGLLDMPDLPSKMMVVPGTR